METFGRKTKILNKTQYIVIIIFASLSLAYTLFEFLSNITQYISHDVRILPTTHLLSYFVSVFCGISMLVFCILSKTIGTKWIAFSPLISIIYSLILSSHHLTVLTVLNAIGLLFSAVMNEFFFLYENDNSKKTFMVLFWCAFAFGKITGIATVIYQYSQLNIDGAGRFILFGILTLLLFPFGSVVYMVCVLSKNDTADKCPQAINNDNIQ